MSHVINSQLICSNYHQDYPLIEKGEGVYLYDKEGRQFIDTSGATAAVTHIGLGRNEVAEVLREQAATLPVHPTHIFYHEGLENYLKNLCEFAPEGFNRAWTISGGTEAVENSIKLAYQYHRSKGNRRTKVLGRWCSYHGNSLTALDVGGMHVRREFYTDLMVDHLHVSACHPYRRSAGLSLEEYEDQLIHEFREIVDQHGDNISCFVAEPVVGAALGAVAPTQNYFKRIAEICREKDILIVADEVMTGMGRTGRNFGMNHFGDHADIMALAKGISSGYFPLGAVIAHDRVYETIKASGAPFFSGQTYSCIPLAAAVGDKVLQIIQKERLVENADNVGQYLLEKMGELYELEAVGNVRGKGLFLGIEFVKNQKTQEVFDPNLRFSKIVEKHNFNNGLISYGGQGANLGQGGDQMLFAPPLILNKDQADEIVDKLKISIKQAIAEIN